MPHLHPRCNPSLTHLLTCLRQHLQWVLKTHGLLTHRSVMHRPMPSAVVVMRRGRTASCRVALTVNRVLLGQSTWDATWDDVVYSWGRQSQLWVEFGAVYNGSCKPQSCQKQKYKYSTVFIWWCRYFFVVIMPECLQIYCFIIGVYCAYYYTTYVLSLL